MNRFSLLAPLWHVIIICLCTNFQHNEDDKKAFYESLDSMVKSTPASDKLITYFNARVENDCERCDGELAANGLGQIFAGIIHNRWINTVSGETLGVPEIQDWWLTVCRDKDTGVKCCLQIVPLGSRFVKAF